MSGYNSAFARYYDRLTENVEYKRRADYFDGLIKQHMGSAGSLLDLACGTGSLSAELSTHGYDVIAVDSAPEMLSIAAQKLPGGLFLCQRMEELDLYGTVEVTVCALDSLNHVTDYEMLCRAFERVSLFTEPGGLFLFDVNSRHKHFNILGDNAFVYEYEDLFCVWQNEQLQDNMVEITLDFFVESAGRYDRYSDCFCERYYSHEELSGALMRAGLELSCVYGDDTLLPPTDSSERLVYVAKKPE